jgi:hypothetical protein
MTRKEATEVARRYYTTKQQKESPYKVGQKVRIIHLEGEDARYDGMEGVIEHIDGIGQLHGTWGGLAIIPEADEFQIIG